MNCSYVLYSEKLGRFYIGACHDDLESRIRKHNSHEYGNHRFTAKAGDWALFLTIHCESFSQAIRIEKHLKRMKSSVYLKNLKKYPEGVEKLKEKYKS